MKKGAILILCLIGLAFQHTATGQNTKEQTFPIHISIMDESISLPNLWFLRYSYNPAIMVGTEYLLKEKNKHDWHLRANVGFYHHKDWQTAIFLLPEIGYRQQIKRWNISARLGAGYNHAFAPRPIYKFEGDQFQQVNDLGTSFFMGSLSLNVGYQLSQKEQAPELYFTFMQSANLPFNNWTSVHQFVGIGYKFYPFK